MRHSRHEGLAPVRLRRLETGSGLLRTNSWPDIGSIGLSLILGSAGLWPPGRQVPVSHERGSAADRSDRNGVQASATLKTPPALRLPHEIGGTQNEDQRTDNQTQGEHATPRLPPSLRLESAQANEKRSGVDVSH
jgi:hypothetical protein